jgi:hypothetical protein
VKAGAWQLGTPLPPPALHLVLLRGFASVEAVAVAAVGAYPDAGRDRRSAVETPPLQNASPSLGSGQALKVGVVALNFSSACAGLCGAAKTHTAGRAAGPDHTGPTLRVLRRFHRDPGRATGRHLSLRSMLAARQEPGGNCSARLAFQPCGFSTIAGLGRRGKGR